MNMTFSENKYTKKITKGEVNLGNTVMFTG